MGHCPAGRIGTCAPGRFSVGCITVVGPAGRIGTCAPGGVSVVCMSSDECAVARWGCFSVRSSSCPANGLEAVAVICLKSLLCCDRCDPATHSVSNSLAFTIGDLAPSALRHSSEAAALRREQMPASAFVPDLQRWQSFFLHTPKTDIMAHGCWFRSRSGNPVRWAASK